MSDFERGVMNDGHSHRDPPTVPLYIFAVRCMHGMTQRLVCLGLVGSPWVRLLGFAPSNQLGGKGAGGSCERFPMQETRRPNDRALGGTGFN